MGERPSGTVTFLFTDIVGSTPLWESVPDEMAVAVARHDELVRGAIAAFGGTVFATGGDGVAAVFARAADAVSAAVELQAQLFGQPWSSSAPIRVRVGLHTGEASERDGDYFGSAVNRAARVMGLALGGQVLVSAVTAAVIGMLPDGCHLIDLGDRALKGLIEPVGIRALGHATIPLVVEAPPDDRVSTGNLPRPSTELVASIVELNDWGVELGAGRVLTLTGTGGVGKTRSAIELGWRARDRFPGGVWFVDLSPLADPVVVADAVLSALGGSVQPGMSATDSIVDWLSIRTALLVLDNCEHLLDAVSSLVLAITARDVPTAILCTSREPLGVRGEIVRRVPSLPIETAAVQLFADRAGAASERFVLSETNRPSVEAICRRLDGIPLAIELAAARVRSLAPDEIVERLDDRFRLLRSAARGGLERHQTLHATVGWSVQLLDPPARALFESLSVFAGSFDLNAAERICGGDGIDELDIYDTLAGLVDKSLVVADTATSPTRYRLLETLRSFGESTLLSEPDRAERLRARHLEVFGERARSVALRYESPEQAEAGRAVAVDWDNYRNAFNWAVRTDAERASELLVDLHRPSVDALRWEHHDWCGQVAEDSVSAYTSLGWALLRADIVAVMDGLPRLPPVDRVPSAHRAEVQRTRAVCTGILRDTRTLSDLTDWYLATPAELVPGSSSQVWLATALSGAAMATGQPPPPPMVRDLVAATESPVPTIAAIARYGLSFAALNDMGASLPVAFRSAPRLLREARSIAAAAGSRFVADAAAGVLGVALSQEARRSDAAELLVLFRDLWSSRLTLVLLIQTQASTRWFAELGYLDIASRLLAFTDRQVVGGELIEQTVGPARVLLHDQGRLTEPMDSPADLDAAVLLVIGALEGIVASG